MLKLILILTFLSQFSMKCEGGSLEEDKYGVIFASDCEVCKLTTKELGERLDSLSSSDVIETGYNIDSKKKKKKYNKSELRLLEALEITCEGMMDYRVHKERKDSTRWAKTMSQTFRTLHGLVNKGVKVDLGIPEDLWDEPSAEVSELRSQCETFLEDNDEVINDWYFGDQSVPLQGFVCSKVSKSVKCLSEPYGEDVSSTESKDEPKMPLKGEPEAKSKKNKEDL